MSIRFPLLAAVLVGVLSLSAQVQINPQLGVNLHQLSGSTPPGVSNRASVGFLVGVDARFGNAFYFQPGVFFNRTVTAYTLETPIPDPDNPGQTITSELEDDLVRSTLKLRTMFGYKIINEEAFRLRLAAGPSYDILMSVDNTGDKIQWNKGDFASGSFNMDLALGLDIGILTVEPGVSIGLTDVYDRDEQAFEEWDKRNLTYFLTFGLVIGGGDER